MNNVPTSFFPTATSIVAELGWQFSISQSGAGILAHPACESLFLRFVMTCGAAKAIAVELVNGNSTPVDYPPCNPIWLVPLDLDPAIAAQQITDNLVQPFLQRSHTQLIDFSQGDNS